MHIVTRHLIHEFLKVFLLSLAGFVCIFLIIDFFEKIDDFMEAGTGFGLTSSYFLSEIPVMIQQVLPAAVLLGTILTLCLMVRNNELIILRSSGISLLRISYPFILISCCFTILLFFINETILPPLNKEINRIWQVEIQKKPLNTFFGNEKIWYRGKRMIFHIDHYDQTNLTMHEVTIYRFSPDFELLERIDAESARWTGSQWILYEGIIQKRSDGGTYKTRYFKESRLDVLETPEDFSRMVRKPEEMNLRALRSYMTKLKKEGYDATVMEVDLHAKIAFPFVCVVMTMLGIPLSLRTENKGGIATAVGAGISSAFLFWILHSISITLGHSGLLPPVMAGWLANGIFLTSGTMLMLVTRQ